MDESHILTVFNSSICSAGGSNQAQFKESQELKEKSFVIR